MAVGNIRTEKGVEDMEENKATEQLPNRKQSCKGDKEQSQEREQKQEQKKCEKSREKIREEMLEKLHQTPSEEALWECILAYQNVTFYTYSGLSFSYYMKCGRNGAYTKELWINRRENSKSLVWSSVRIAYQKVLELQKELRKTKQEEQEGSKEEQEEPKEERKEERKEEPRPYVERPKALGDIRGITYIYGIFQQFALIEVPEKVKEKQREAMAQSETGSAQKMSRDFS